MSNINVATSATAKLARFAGDLYVFPIDALGNKTGGASPLGHVTVANIGAPETEDAEEKSRATANYDETIRTESGSISQIFSVTTKSNTLENVMLALGGTTSAKTQTAGSDATPQNITAELGKVFALNGKNLDPATMPLVQDETDTTTYVLDTDYEIDSKAGLIKILEGGSITEAEVLHVTSTWLEYNGDEVKANKALDSFYRLEVVNKNEIDSSMEYLYFPKCTLKLTGDMARIGEPTEYQEIAMEANLSKLGEDYWTLERYPT